MIGPTLPNSTERKLNTAPTMAKARQSHRAACPGAPVDHHTDQKNPQETCQKRKRSRSEEKTADQRGGHAGQGEPTDDGQVKFTSVEPGATQVPQQLRHGENGDRLTHAEESHEQRQQDGRAAETRHRRQHGTHKSAARKQDQILDRHEGIHTTSGRLESAPSEA